MKNKKLGKILLCTTLALATPFALVGCSKQANNDNTPDTPQEQQQVTTRNYVKEVTWPSASSQISHFENDDQIRATLADIMYDPSIMENYRPAPDDPEYNNKNAVYQQMLDWYREALSNLINRYIVDSETQSVNETVSTKYVYSVPESCIENYDQNKALSEYYEEFYQAYSQKYVADSNWQGIDGTDGVFYTVNENRTEDVLISFEYDSSAKTITIYEFSFSKGGIATAYANILENMQSEIETVRQTAH